MNVTHIITSLESGGAQRALYTLIESDVSKSAPFIHEVLYLHEGPYVEKLRELGIKVRRMTGFFAVYDPTILWRLYWHIIRVQPSVIHTSLWLAGVLGRVTSLLSGVPVLCDVHSDVAHHGWGRILIDRVTAGIGRTYYCAVSQHLKNSFQDHISKISPITVVYNGIDASVVRECGRLHPVTRRELHVPDDAFVMGSVGRLVPIKRYEELLWCHAVLRHKKGMRRVITCIVGDGPEKERLQERARSLGIAQEVLFLGHRDDVYSIYPLFDCFVQSSQSEGLSYAVLEALCFGLPIIVSHEYERHEIITDQEHGFVVPAQSGGSGLARAMVQLLRFPQRYNELKDKNIALVQHDYARSTMVARYHALYTHHGSE